jgi:hypothetical protein
MTHFKSCHKKKNTRKIPLKKKFEGLNFVNTALEFSALKSFAYIECKTLISFTKKIVNYLEKNCFVICVIFDL